MSLPIYKDDSKNLMLLQTNWASSLDPLLASPIGQGRQINNVVLLTGPNIINHKLGRKLQGWFLVGINGAAIVYDAQVSNPHPELTLALVANSGVTVSLWVY